MTKSWFSDAWVGRVKKMTSFDKAEEEITWEIGGDIAPKYLGDDAILLLGLTDNRAEDLANEENTQDDAVLCFGEMESRNQNGL